MIVMRSLPVRSVSVRTRRVFSSLLSILRILTAREVNYFAMSLASWERWLEGWVSERGDFVIISFKRTNTFTGFLTNRRNGCA